MLIKASFQFTDLLFFFIKLQLNQIHFNAFGGRLISGLEGVERVYELTKGGRVVYISVTRQSPL